MITKIKGCLKEVNFKQLLGQRIKVLTSLVLVLILAFGVCLSSIKTVVIADGDNFYTVRTTSSNPEAILSSVGLKVTSDDAVVSGDSVITIKRAFDVTVKADGETRTVKMAEGSVKDAIYEAGFSYVDSDVINYDLDQELTEGMEIKITRVEYKYKTKVKNTDEGKVKITYRKKLVNGKLTQTKAVKKKVIAKKKYKYDVLSPTISPAKSAKKGGAVSELKPPSSLKLNKKGIPAKYKKVITGKATAYYNRYNRHCATGVTPRPGYIAVNPKQIPYGTKMYIVSNDGRYVYGYAIAADTGGFANGSGTVCDLFFNTKGECIQFGRRNVTIYIL